MCRNSVVLYFLHLTGRWRSLRLLADWCATKPQKKTVARRNTEVNP